MHGIDWNDDHVQRIYSSELYDLVEAADAEAMDALHAAIDAMPDLTLRQMVALEASEAYWRIREFVQRAWLAL